MSSLTTRYIPILSDALPDEALIEVYNKLERENVLGRLFYCNEVSNATEFVQLARTKSTLLYVCIDSELEDIVAVVWLNGRTDCNCTLHGSFFKNYYRVAIDIYKTLLRGFFKEIPGLESIIGFVPTKNRLAVSFAKRSGWTEGCTIPSTIRNSKTQELDSMILFYILKDKV